MQSILIDKYKISYGSKPLVIAEAGINHNGDIKIAKDMIAVACEAGADIIKFQTHLVEYEMLKDYNSSDSASHIKGSLYDLLSQCSFSLDEHIVLMEEAKRLGILFLSTPFSIEAVDLLEQVGVDAYKIGSGEILNTPFLKYVAEKGKPLILSTGTANWEELVNVIDTIKEYNSQIVLMQCTSNYPTTYNDVNVGVIDKMHLQYPDIPIGLSDHCIGNYACYAAVARGASIVEKHFTLSKKMPGPDQSSSIEFIQLKELVDGVHSVYLSLGNEKKLNSEALKVRAGFSESIVTIREIKKGEKLIPRENIWVKRPGTGIPSYEIDSIAGKIAKCDLENDHLLSMTDV